MFFHSSPFLVIFFLPTGPPSERTNQSPEATRQIASACWRATWSGWARSGTRTSTAWGRLAQPRRVDSHVRTTENRESRWDCGYIITINQAEYGQILGIHGHFTSQNGDFTLWAQFDFRDVSHLQPLAPVAAVSGCQVAASGCKWLTGQVAASGCQWLQVADSGCKWLPSGCKWLQVADGASGCKWLQVAASGCKWLQVADGASGSQCGCKWLPSGCKWLTGQVAASGCKWLQVAASGCKWLKVAASGCQAADGASGCKWLTGQVAASGCKWLQVAASGCKWLTGQVAASGCQAAGGASCCQVAAKWLQVVASGCKWLPSGCQVAAKCYLEKECDFVDFTFFKIAASGCQTAGTWLLEQVAAKWLTGQVAAKWLQVVASVCKWLPSAILKKK